MGYRRAPDKIDPRLRCQLCKGDGVCIHDAHARCSRCDGAGQVPEEMDQDKIQTTRIMCGRCGDAFDGDDGQYAPPCPRCAPNGWAEYHAKNDAKRAGKVK